MTDPRPSFQPVRVLVADDADDLRQLVVRLLGRDLRIVVVGQAADSDSALTLSHELDPDVVVLDLSMPGAGGLGVLAVLRETQPRTRVVVLSGLPSHATEAACLNAGAYAYLEKGVGISTLADLIVRAAVDGVEVAS